MFSCDFDSLFVRILILCCPVLHVGGWFTGKPRDNRQKDLLRPALDEIIDPGHALVRLAREIDWDFLDGRFSSVCRSGPGHPPLPSRLVAGLPKILGCR